MQFVKCKSTISHASDFPYYDDTSLQISDENKTFSCKCVLCRGNGRFTVNK